MPWSIIVFVLRIKLFPWQLRPTMIWKKFSKTKRNLRIFKGITTVYQDWLSSEQHEDKVASLNHSAKLLEELSWLVQLFGIRILIFGFPNNMLGKYCDKCIWGSHEILTLIPEDVQCFNSVSGSSSGWYNPKISWFTYTLQSQIENLSWLEQNSNWHFRITILHQLNYGGNLEQYTPLWTMKFPTKRLLKLVRVPLSVLIFYKRNA